MSNSLEGVQQLKRTRRNVARTQVSTHDTAEQPQAEIIQSAPVLTRQEKNTLAHRRRRLELSPNSLRQQQLRSAELKRIRLQNLLNNKDVTVQNSSEIELQVSQKTQQNN